MSHTSLPLLPHPQPPVRIPRAFAHVKTWVFDLDNTLYPHACALWPQIDARITAWVMEMFGLDGTSARALQKHWYHRHGTTLRALMDLHAIDPKAFLDFAHDIDRSGLLPDAALTAAIAALPGRRLILTNGDRDHALRTTEKLGIAHLFEDIFDIEAAAFTPKPERAAYERFLDRHGVEPREAAMFEDLARNLQVPHAMGMTTVLVLPAVFDPFREAHEQTGADEPHIDHATVDLAGFLAPLATDAGPGLIPSAA